MAVAWSPDGRTLATGSVRSPTSNTVNLWDAATGRLERTLRTRYSGGKFYRLGWSPDGSLLVGGAIDYREWRSSGEPLFSHAGCPNCTPAWGFAWNPNGTMWGIGDESGYVWVYGTNGTLLGQVRNPAGNVDVMAWSPDGRTLAAANSLWTTGVAGLTPAGLTGPGRVLDLSWSPQGAELAATFLHDQRVEIFAMDGRHLVDLVGGGQAGPVAWSPNGALLASGSERGTVCLWNAAAWRTGTREG
jgi:WD40 repeat protein